MALHELAMHSSMYAADIGLDMELQELPKSVKDGVPAIHFAHDAAFGCAESAPLSRVLPVHVRIDNLRVQAPLPGPRRNPLLRFKRRSVANDAPPQWKNLLDNVTAEMPAGSLTAIIGSSGSGKTTLLSTLARRLSTRKLKVSGDITFNDQQDLRAVGSAYVMQQDLLLPTLTVRETLHYAADLRLPSPANAADRSAIVESVLLELGLKDCADTRIGSHFHKGCSGGEKRRTSIGVQMLANPSVLFCDEPTTGLDAHSAYQVVRSLRRLAERGRTIILSIHAPRSEIWSLFDRVVLLSRGYTLYSGLASGAVPYFQDCGFELPAFVNPAEWLIDLAAIDNRSEEAEDVSHNRVMALKEAWDRHSDSLEDVIEDREPSLAATSLFQDISPQRVGFTRQLSVLTTRGIKVAIRDPMSLGGSLLEAFTMSIVAGWIFLHIGKDLAGIRSRQGALYTATALQPYLIIMVEAYRLTTDIQVFDRERSEGVATVPAFLLSRRLSRLFLEDLPVPTIFATILYFMAGFRDDAATFFIFLAVQIVIQFITVTLAGLCVAFSRDFAKASLLANLFSTVQVFGCGYFVQVDQIPIWLRWLKWVAYNFYTFGALITNEFIGVNGGPLGQIYDCPSQNITSTECQQYTGRFVVQSMGFPSNWIWRPILISASFIVLFSLASWLVLTFNKVDVDVVGTRKGDTDRPARDKHIVVQSSQEIRQVTVGLDKYALDVHLRHLWKRNQKKHILRDVTTNFEPGKLNVIMGPSGSGKTSLLQSIAQRLSSGVFSKYEASGDILLNNAIPSADVLASVTSFVTQDDTALMPALTVRETLRFAAAIRLPKWMNTQQKYQRAEEVILKMGLKDCADSIVGDDQFKKGISGGEKRRVSIAVQILTDPKVLLLDEPTSGLDVFLASSIIDVLKSLAAEGRTIVMTLHQTRSDLFAAFDNVLLLARGGSVVYAGQCQSMLPYFQALGYKCQESTNPADFALDLISVNLQQGQDDFASRKRVDRIVSEWQATQKLPTRTSLHIASAAELSSFKREMNPFYVTFPFVLRRSAINLARNSEVMVSRVGQVIGITVLTTLFFAPLQHNYESIQSRLGFLQQQAALYFVGLLQNLAVYPLERDTFYREHADGCYTSATFLISYTVLETPFTAISALIFGILASYACNLKRTVSFLFISALNCFCIVSCGESIGIMFCTIFSSHVGFAVNVTSTLLTISTTMAGIMSLDIPSFLQALNHLSPLKYLVANMAAYSLHGQTFTCSEAQMSDGECPISTGEQVLDLYRLNVNAHLNLMALVIAAVVYRILAFAVLKVSKW